MRLPEAGLTARWSSLVLRQTSTSSSFLSSRHANTYTRTVPFGSLPVPILTLEDLIILKTLAGRLQDRADLEKIRARQADLHIDGAYVDHWKKTLGLGDQ